MALAAPAGDVAARFALDAGALAGLKQQAKTAPDQALRGAASQFEALFMQMLMKSMRESLPQDGPLASDASRMYTGMLDGQLAQQLGKRGIGIADLLVKQLSRGPARTTAGGGEHSPATSASAATSPLRTMFPAGGAGAAKPATRPMGAAPGDDTGSGSVVSATTSGVRAFLEKLQPYAEAVGRAAGLPSAFLLAQAGLETGWGRSQPRGPDGAPSHNLFGIKAGKAWSGPVVEAATTEYVNGRPVTTVEKFRAYASYGEALQDFARLVSGNPRYAGAVASAGDAGAYAQALQKAGYATDPRYAEKLTAAIRMVGRHAGIAAAPAPAQVLAARADIRA